jgi:hypothetical protein
MLELCLLMLAGLVLVCGAQVEQLAERQRRELAASSTEDLPAFARNLRQWFPR